MWVQWHCSRTHKSHPITNFNINLSPTTLFTYLKIILLQCFQFSANKQYPNTPLPFVTLQEKGFCPFARYTNIWSVQFASIEIKKVYLVSKKYIYTYEKIEMHKVSLFFSFFFFWRGGDVPKSLKWRSNLQNINHGYDIQKSNPSEDLNYIFHMANTSNCSSPN